MKTSTAKDNLCNAKYRKMYVYASRKSITVISETFEISKPPFFDQVVAKDAFLSKIRHLFMLQYMQSNEDRHHLHKQAHDKSIAESLHAYINRARLTACKVGVFLREMS